MINMIVTGQELSIVTARVVSGTHNYLEVNGDFRTADWTGLRKWVHFTMGEFKYVMPMVNDKIQSDQHLDLTEGTWEVYIHGNLISDDEVTERVTTDVKLLFVDAPHTGHPFPPLTPDFEEVLANRVEHAVDVAESVREDADDGEFDGATYLPSVDNTTGDISWTNDQGKENPPTRNIKGPKGDTGDSAVYVGENQPTDPNVNVWIKPSALGGKVITSFTLVSGTHAPGTYDNYRIEFSDGDPLTFSVYNGSDGSGIGDMIKSVYDSHNKAQDIFDYADSKAAAVKDTTTKTGILKGSSGSIVAAVAGTDYQTPLVAGTDYQTPLTIDSSMSDSSTNTVQNKIIKAYVDAHAGSLYFCEKDVTTYAEISAAFAAEKIPVYIDFTATYPRLYVCQKNQSQVYSYYIFSAIRIDLSVTTGQTVNAYLSRFVVKDDDTWNTVYGTKMLLASDLLSTVTSGSSEGVTSNAVYTAIQNAKVTVDSAMSSSSTNPVQNRVIYNALQNISSIDVQERYATINVGVGATIGANIDVSRSGYKPLGVVGISLSNMTALNVTSYRLVNNVISYYVVNRSQSSYTDTVIFQVLYKKN